MPVGRERRGGGGDCEGVGTVSSCLLSGSTGSRMMGFQAPSSSKLGEYILYTEEKDSPRRSGNLSSVQDETDDQDDGYEDYHIPINIEVCCHRYCAVHRVATMCNNGLYDLRCVNTVRNITGVASGRDTVSMVCVGDIIRIDRYSGRKRVGHHVIPSLGQEHVKDFEYLFRQPGQSRRNDITSHIPYLFNKINQEPSIMKQKHLKPF